MKKFVSCLLLLTAVMGGCCCNRQAGLTADVLRQDASAWPLEVSEGVVFTDNDAAFLNKLEMVRKAKKSIDLASRVYADDHSSAVLTKALLGAAQRGIPVRLLVDYEANYKNLDFYSMMEREGRGHLRIRFYNRPTANIVKDAAFMTMGCSKEKAGSPAGACSAERLEAIDRVFAEERIAGVPAAGLNISNLNTGNSGLFLSGLYSKRADVVAFAVRSGGGNEDQDLKNVGVVSTAPQKENLMKLGKAYGEARTDATFQRLAADADACFAFSRYGEQFSRLRETVAAMLPAARPPGADEARDWEHIADSMRQKLLLVDGSAVQMGGRDVEDASQMHPNPLVAGHVFVGIDVYATLDRGGDAISRAFEALWNFQPMVATLAEVRQHAPNEFVANLELAEKACSAKEKITGFDACVAKEQQRTVYSLPERMGIRWGKMEENGSTYVAKYLATIDRTQKAGFPLDKTSTLAYLEDLPFDRGLPAEKRRRTYGTSVGQEAAGGKYIHDTWLRAIPGVCAAATPTTPKRVVFHNAHFLPPADLTYELSRMVNGELDCSNVTVTVLTNSADTSPINLVARHAMKAFAEFYRQSSDPARRATFDYYEYLPPAQGHNLPLRGGVSVFGDDVIIGSTGIDVRSFMMDSTNAMLIRNAPAFKREYLDFIDKTLADPARVNKVSDYFASTPREVMTREDVAAFRQFMSRNGAGEKVTDDRSKEAEEHFVRMLNDAYELTKASIAIDSTANSRKESQEKFNNEFESI